MRPETWRWQSIKNYFCSSTPAARPGLTEDGEGNIYEEIIPPHTRLFFSISQGRRDNLELYKFADWDLEDKLRPNTDKVRDRDVCFI